MADPTHEELIQAIADKQGVSYSEAEYFYAQKTGYRPDYQKVFAADPAEIEAKKKQFMDKPSTLAVGGLQQLISLPTFEFGDEVVAKIAAPFISMSTGEDVDLSYDKALEVIRGAMKAYGEDQPEATVGLKLAGSAPMAGTKPAQALYSATKSMSLPAKLATLSGTGAGVGFVEGVGAGDGDFSDRLESGVKGAGVGAAAGLVLPAAGAVGSKLLIPAVAGLGRSGANVVNWMADRLLKRTDAPITDDSGMITSDTIQALEDLISKQPNPKAFEADIKQQLINEGVLTPDQAKAFNLFKEYGLDPLRAQVTRSTDDWVEVQDAAKYSGDVAQKLADQEKILKRLVTNQANAISDTTLEHQETNDFLYRIALDTVSKYDDEVTKAYTKAREAAGGLDAQIPLQGVVKTVNGLKSNDKITKGMIEAINGRLKELGVMDKSGKPIFRTVIDERGLEKKVFPELSIEDAENFRIFLNDFYDSTSPRGRQIIKQLKDVIDTDVEKVVGKDIFKDARAAKIQMQNILENQKRSKYDVAGKSLVEKMLDGKIKQGDILNKILASDKTDLAKLKQFYLQDAGDDGLRAWDSFRAQVLRDAFDKSIKAGTREGGEKVFNSRIFGNEIQKLRRKGLFDQIYDNPEEVKFINDIIKLGEYRTPVADTFKGSGPSGRSVQEGSFLLQSLLDTVSPGLGLGDRILKRVKMTKAEKEAADLQKKKLERQTKPLKQTEEKLKQDARKAELLKKYGFE